MREYGGTFVERIADTGEWFERGVRVEYFPAVYDPRLRVLERAALGSYVVVSCDRIEADDRRWLDVRLQPLTFA